MTFLEAPRLGIAVPILALGWIITVSLSCSIGGVDIRIRISTSTGGGWRGRRDVGTRLVKDHDIGIRLSRNLGGRNAEDVALRASGTVGETKSKTQALWICVALLLARGGRGGRGLRKRSIAAVGSSWSSVAHLALAGNGLRMPQGNSHERNNGDSLHFGFVVEPVGFFFSFFLFSLFFDFDFKS